MKIVAIATEITNVIRPVKPLFFLCDDKWFEVKF